ncbi:hypothetical protein H6G33_17925 [Calothrix sp. FACHB-1219]|uniref:hypothetical protein n=1 Tax=unclassified Calothrix TaxID=2619626 RepID=UPI0016859A47|nr:MULTISPECIES: hypothetical protein [unclassified Calothrix]MBD2202758.1 hypothetical protein [Calothrix sp. FACHB-168]MBD2218911.1 hypothetical protein [Calothrix sp. FACHB-1219]
MPLFNNSISSNKIIHLVDSRPSGTNGGGTASGWNDRVINSIRKDDTGLVTLSNNQFVLPAGNYSISAVASFYKSYETKLRLFNNTDSSTLLVGLNSYIGNLDSGLIALLDGVFEITANQSLSIQYRANNTNMATIGVGAAAGFGVEEIYLSASLQKLD